VAGNIVSGDILGSIEFACAALGAKVVLVLVHEHCGDVKGAIANIELGNLTALLRFTAPAIDEVAGHEPRSAANAAFVHAVAEQNVRRTLRRARDESAVLRELEASGGLLIVGGTDNMGTVMRWVRSASATSDH
jgi:carbonic anhydrase